MRIKRKVEMTLEEYAKYMIDKHGVRGYENSLIDTDILGAPYRFTLTFELNAMSKEDLPSETYRNRKVIVEVEEEITENTKFPKLVERWRHRGDSDEEFRYVEHNNKSIDRVLLENPESVEVTHFYIENDDRELVLIWRDGELV